MCKGDAAFSRSFGCKKFHKLGARSLSEHPYTLVICHVVCVTRLVTKVPS